MSSAYRLTGRHEAGELAELYDAVQEPGGLPVVIKLFHPKTSDPRYATTLAGTYGVLNPLRTEGLVHVLDLGFVKNRLAVVREAVAAGSSLGAVLQRLNSKEVLLPPSVALGLILQLLDTVEGAHAAGIVHGALTPGNVLLTRTGQPQVCDFGALHALLAVPELKRAFVGRGRSAYRAPEVGRGGEPDTLSDLYSIGAIAYELLTLREAVVPEGGMSTRRAGLPPPSRLDRRIHARLDPLILRALEGTPTRRYRSCGEFATALRGFLSNQGGLPGAEELRRFMAELLPGAQAPSSPGPLPFTERFSLTPISGVSLAQVSADPLERSVAARAPFSPALSEADTMEAPPAFEEYSAPSPAQAELLQSTHVLSGAAAPYSPSGVSDTHIREVSLAQEAAARLEAAPESAEREPGAEGSGDDEQTWVAPPGAAPVKVSRRAATQSASREGSRVGKNPRLRVVEDFTQPLPPSARSEPRADYKGEPRGDPDDLVDTTRIPMTGTRPRLPPSLVRAAPSAPAEPPEPPALPSATAPEMPAVIAERQRMFTEERNLLADTWSRRRMLAVAGAIALVGLACFALGVWKYAQPPPGDSEATSEATSDTNKVSAVSGAVQQYLQEPPPAPVEPTPAPPPAAVPRAEPPAASSLEPAADPKTNVAWLSLQSNRPARAYIDGVRVKRSLPLVRYPIKPGTREVIIETLRVPRQREVFQLRLGRGEHKKVAQQFAGPRRP